MCLAIPGRLVAVSADNPHVGTVEVSGVRRQVNIALVCDDGAAEGDWVLLHVGFAMSLISEAEAQEQIRFLTMMGEAGEALDEVTGYSFGDDPSGDGSPKGTPERLG